MYDYKYLLDKRREGQEFSLVDINRALRDAGDLAPDRSERMDTQVSIEGQRSWSTKSTDLVGGCEDGNPEKTWSGWSRYLDFRNES